MFPNEGFAPASEGSLTIEERIVQIKESETHESSIAWTLDLVLGLECDRGPRVSVGHTTMASER